MTRPPPSPVAAQHLAAAVAHLQRGEVAQAIGLLQTATAAAPDDPEPPLHLGLARRLSGDLSGALAAFDMALARDPYFFMALLSKATVLEALQRHDEAVRDYGNALKIAPDWSKLPPPARVALERGQKLVEDARRNKADYLHKALSKAAGAASAQSRARIAETIDILAGVKKYYVHEPLFLTIPGLPTVGYFDRALFPWFAELEAATAMITAELQGALTHPAAGFEAYIQRPPGAPLNQWAELNNNRDWSTLHLWRDGKAIAGAQALCPKTTALLKTLPLADQPGYAPTAMFSVMQPHTHIPPHTGSTNARAIVHLALVVPGQCRFRVGNEVREWRVGEAFAFDDTIEHEAFNDSDEVRVVLILDAWNPYLTADDRALVTALGQALHAYSARG